MEKVIYEEPTVEETGIEETVKAIAQVCYEANRAYCATLGGFSGPPWHGAPKWHQDSIKKGVAHFIKNWDLTVEQLHELWLNDKREQGWTYGPVLNEAEKVHPCFVPYGSLPVEQRMKDYLFSHIVRAYLEAYGAIDQLKAAAETKGYDA